VDDSFRGDETGVYSSSTHSQLPDMAKWILSLCTIAGQLEFDTLLVIFTRPFWQWCRDVVPVCADLSLRVTAQRR